MTRGQIWRKFPKLLRFMALFPSLEISGKNFMTRFYRGILANRNVPFCPACPLLSRFVPVPGTKKDRRGQTGTKQDISGQCGEPPHSGSTPISSSRNLRICFVYSEGGGSRGYAQEDMLNICNFPGNTQNSELFAMGPVQFS